MNLPGNAGDTGLIPGQGTKIPHVTEQLGPRTATTELPRQKSVHCKERSWVLQLRPKATKYTKKKTLETVGMTVSYTDNHYSEG